MSLVEKFSRELESWPLFQHGEATLETSDSGQNLSCALTALDTLGCAFTDLTLHSDRLIGASAERLQKIAVDLAKRLTYLLEPISPIEMDAEYCIVQMRSTPPKKHADGTDYYELLVTKTGELSLRRFSRGKGSPRAIIPASVTREVLVRLAGDLAQAA